MRKPKFCIKCGRRIRKVGSSYCEICLLEVYLSRKKMGKTKKKKKKKGKKKK